MASRKLGFDESLQKDVVSTNQCTGCATCVVVCPIKCLEYDQGHPRLSKDCTSCGICPRVCPRFDWSWGKAEEFVFGRQSQTDEEFGIYRSLLLAQASNKEILERCQDGGAVTALLTHALQTHMIDGIALSGLSQEKSLYPEPRLAATSREVLDNAGTRYCYSPNMLALGEGLKQKKERLAFVGTPCQIQAIRKIQMFPLKKFASPLQFAVGLMCTESFTYDGFVEEHLRENMGLDLSDVEKMNIKGKILVSLKSGGVETIPLSTAKRYVREGCRVCSDFSSELADISAGGLGLNGWTFLVLRTEGGEALLNSAHEAGMVKTREVAEEPRAQALLTMLSKRKRRNHPRG